MPDSHILLYHTGPGSCASPNCWSLAPSPPAPLWPGKQVWSLWASLHHFTPWTHLSVRLKLHLLWWLGCEQLYEGRGKASAFSEVSLCPISAASKRQIKMWEGWRPITPHAPLQETTSLQELPLAGGFCCKSQPWEGVRKSTTENKKIPRSNPFVHLVIWFLSPELQKLFSFILRC